LTVRKRRCYNASNLPARALGPGLAASKQPAQLAIGNAVEARHAVVGLDSGGLPGIPAVPPPRGSHASIE